MAVSEKKVTGKFYRIWSAADKLWHRISFWTHANDVEFNDGKTAQTKVGAIKGITTSTSATETGYAADATTVAALNQSLDEKFTIIGVNETIDNISIGANGTTQVNFTKFKPVKGYTRIIVNTSFWNATTNGGGYSNAFVYSMIYASSGVGIQMKNIANAGIRVKLSVTCLYFNSYIENSVIPTPIS